MWTLLFQPQFLSKNWTKCLIALTEKFYTTTESHIDLRKNSEAYEYLRSITDYISKIETKVNVYCLDGLIQTINGVLALADDLFETTTQFFLTLKVNQDPIENMFGLIRARGGFNRNLSVKEFNYLIGRIMSMKILGGPKLTTNCEADNDEHVFSLNDSLSLNEQTDINGTTSEPDDTTEAMEYIASNYFDITNNFDNNKDEITDSLRNQIKLQAASIRYFAGYMVFKLFKNLNCSSCINAMKKSESVMNDNSELLLFNKNFYINSDFGSLIPPTDLFFKICELHVEVFTNFFKLHPQVVQISEKICNLCIEATNSKKEIQDWFSVSECKEHRNEAMKILIKILLA